MTNSKVDILADLLGLKFGAVQKDGFRYADGDNGYRYSLGISYHKPFKGKIVFGMKRPIDKTFLTIGLFHKVPNVNGGYDRVGEL